jgi:hypothetical protein
LRSLQGRFEGKKVDERDDGEGDVEDSSRRQRWQDDDSEVLKKNLHRFLRVAVLPDEAAVTERVIES